MTRDVRCAHCTGLMLGQAGRQLPDSLYEPLCHPDWGLDCYSLVTVARHDTPCEWCRLVRIERDSIRRKQEDLMA